MKKFFYLIMMGLALTVTGCSSDEPDPDGGGEINPDVQVPDPTGTIQLSMRNNDKTSLDGLYIGSDDNFHGSDWKIASLGKVQGLGNVSTIPLAGWADEVAVVPGNGYVAYNSDHDQFYRIYVADYIGEAVSGGVIGAEVKYQKSFRGLDEEIRLSADKVVLSAEGAREQVVFDNSSIVPFTVKSSANWCRVEKSSTRDFSFLYDAVVISCDESFSATEQEATVTLETLYGNKTEITVTRQPRGEFFIPSVETLYFEWNPDEQMHTLNVFTNVEPTDIRISTSDWIKAEFTGRNYSPRRAVRWIADRPVTRATLENPVDKELAVIVQPNVATNERTGIITLSYGNVKRDIHVVQGGSNFTLMDNDVTFEANSELSKRVKWSGSLNYSNLYAEYSADGEKWCSVDIQDRYLTVTVTANPKETLRLTDVKIMCRKASGEGGTEVAVLRVNQKAMKYEDVNLYFQSSASNASLIFPLLEDATISSSADWCTATPQGSNLVIRATATTENRFATITISGISAKIYVSQSKYKVHDTYDEDGVTGKVYSMENGVGLIYKHLEGRYSWSTENVLTGANSETDGEVNMAKIRIIPGWKELYPAFAAVDALNTEGVTGWYLPAYNEIRRGNFQRDDKWSSTEVDEDRASTGDGSDSDRKVNKSDSYYVTAVHKFSYDFKE